MDLKIPPSLDQERRFIDFCKSAMIGNRFILKE
jgi:hypothetical protein